jgi:Protein of unknown function (DUF2975)
MSSLPAAPLSAPLSRIARLSRALEIATDIGIALVAALTIAGLLIPDWTRNLLLAKLGQTGAALPVTAPARLAAAVVVAVPVAVMLYGLFAVRALFREFAQGRVFTMRAAHHLQVFAATVLAQAPLGPLTSAGLSFAVSMAQETGPRMFAIAFSLHDYYALIVGGALFAIASVMREAARLADENAGFV